MKREGKILIISGILIVLLFLFFILKSNMTGFVSYTEIENITTAHTYAEISTNFSNVSSMEYFIFSWNNTNYTFYNTSLVLMMDFDNRSALSENDTHVFDASIYQNNGTVFGATFNSSGKYHGAFDFDGIDDYINAGNDSTLNITENITISVWINAGTSTTSLGNVSSYVKLNDTSLDGKLDAGDYFGDSVASLGDLDGDGVVDLAIGSRRDDDGGTDVGTVWILFMYSNGSVKSYTKINDTSMGGVLDAGDYFGKSLDNIGDLNNDGTIDLVVGANKDNDCGDYSGAVYILFMNSNGSVKDYVKLNCTILNVTIMSSFGGSVAKIGDLDGDGITDIGGGRMDAQGFLIMFMHSNGSMKSYAKINDTSFGGGKLDDNDFFGIAVTSLGDLDGDGVIDLAAGADRDDDGKENAGAAYILFMHSNGSMKSYAKINDTTLDGKLKSDDYFGNSVCNPGDLDGDGVVDLLVGASRDSDGNYRAGAVWMIFLNPNGSVKSYKKINDTSLGGNLDEEDQFGAYIDDLGDLDGDGIIDIAIGARQDDDGGESTGAAWILFLEDGMGSVLNKQNSYQIRANSTHVKSIINGTYLIGSLNSGWNHIAITSNTTDQSLYINGDLVSTTTSGILASSIYDLYIGKDFNGTIDNLQIWNKSLSDPEISQLYYSNLYKLNNTAWNFYIKKQRLFDGIYNYSFFIKDDFGLIQSSIGEIIIDYLMNDVFMTAVTGNSILLSMVFKNNMDAYVEYGTSSGNYESSSEVYINQTANESLEITLEDLQESTRYYFRFRVRGNATGEDYIAFDEHNFTTRRRPGESFTFVHFTDSHLGKDLQPYYYNQDYINIINNMTELIKVSGADFVVDTGDTGQPQVAGGTYNAQNQSDTNARYSLVRNYFENMSLPIYLSLGNHDAEVGWGAYGTNNHSEDLYNWSLHARLNYWPNPTNETYSYGGGPYENYYAFDWGDATFILLDSYRYNTIAPPTGEDWVLGDAQMDWLESTLRTSDKKWKFVFSHHILGGADLGTAHGYNYGDGGGNYSWIGDQANINHLMEQYNAQIFFYGHVHRFYHDWANWSGFGRTNYVNYVAGMGGSWQGSEICSSANRISIYPNAICNRGYTLIEVSPYNVSFHFVNWFNESYLYNYTINNTAPSISLVSPINDLTINSNNFVFHYSDSEYDNGKNCTLYIDGIQKATQHGTISGVDTTFTVSDLSEQYHTWYVNCSDGALFTVSETRTFTYFTDSSDSVVYSASSTQLQEGYSKLLRNTQKVQLTIKEQIHTVVVDSVDIGNKKVKIQLEETNSTFEITEKETKKIDLDNDGYYDLQISVKEVRTSGYADLEFKEIHEQVPAQEQEEQKELSKIEQVKWWIWLIIGTGLLIIVGGIIILKNSFIKKKHKKEN